MRPFVVIAILLFIISNATFAQIQRTPVKQPADSNATNPETVQQENSRKEIFKELDLTGEQRKQLKEISQAAKTAKETIENDNTLSESEKKTELRTLRKNNALKIDSILTEEQKIKFRQLRRNKNTP